jgi:predicted glycogen debranching enzyme
MIYPAERERGYACTETLFSPGVFSAKLQRGDELHLAASVEGLSPSEALDLLDRQAFRKTHLLKSYEGQNGIERTDFSDALLSASDSFVNTDGKRHWITAGFHWFSEWGRDSMICLPGLLLCTGRHAMAREVLFAHAGRVEDGLLPNFIDESGQAHYNSSDASLWYLNAVREYVEWTGDFDFVQQRLWKSMRGVLSGYMQGNGLVRMEGDCLLRVLSPSSTWMDAQAGGSPVTPRKGKPVEINALWHSGLCFMQGLAARFADRRTEAVVAPLIEESRESFQAFVSHEGGLFDVLEPNDASLRPNQLFAVSLPHSPLNGLQKKHVFNLIRSRLYTPLGLHTLSPSDSRYCGTYSGGPSQRDSAYHQGMAWPWLLGAFYDAQLSIHPGSERQVLSSLRPVWEAMKSGKGCIGSLPEMYEPATGKPSGAISQAWSVAEVLRIYTKVKRTAAAVSAAPERKGIWVKTA